MPESQHRPVLLVLTSHWISMAGVTLVTLAGFSWLFVLPANIRGTVGNPYIGLLAFIAIPLVFFAGLALIPLGIYLGRRRIASGLENTDRRAAWRRAGAFFAIMTLANLVIGSQVSYRAVAHMETNQFCGQTCHVMAPEFSAHLLRSHQQVACASCHIVAGPQGWVKAKMAGTRQLAAVIFNSYPRPIESALESNRLAASADTCEQCHARDRYIGPRLRTISHYKDDENNTRTDTVLMMMVGGGGFGGIHGAHMGPGVRVRYAASDKKRQVIPWVEYTANNTTTTYAAAGAKPDPSTALFEMQCADCHNRAGHNFQPPDRAVDEAITAGQIAAGLPFVKKTGVELLNAKYSSQDEAAQRIIAGLTAFYQQKHGEVWASRSNDIQLAGQALAAIYKNSVFPDLGVTWGTYPNNLGHMDDPGCFRCHDDSHAAPGKKTITQDCSACHQALAMDETAPPVLKMLGLDQALSKLQRH